MNYEKIYNNLCNRGKMRSKGAGCYLEKHHIIPIFFFKESKRKHRYSDGIFEGDGENIANLTYLTPREHFIAHVILAKIWSNTKWYHRCRSSLLMFFNYNSDSNHKRSNYFNPGYSKKYQKYRQDAIESISKIRKGTMPAKDSITNEIVGSVPVDHPNVLSGKWVHHSKNVKHSDARRKITSNISKGLSNSNSKYSDSELVDSYIKCCKNSNLIVNQSFWIKYSIAYNLPYLKHFKEFRLNGNGFQDLIDIAVLQTDLKLPSDGLNPFHGKKYKEFLRRSAIWVSP